MYYYIPQHSWGLCQQPNVQVTGFYSFPGGPCKPVALWCPDTERGAFAHWDVSSVLTINLIDWLNNDDIGQRIDIYAPGSMEEEVIERINELLPGANPNYNETDGSWGFTFYGEREAISVTDIPPEQKENAPNNWSDYWDGAPDWKGGSTFTAEIILDIDGFFANYNGLYYFDFR